MADEGQQQEILVITREELDYARRVAQENGVVLEEVEQHGLEPVTTVTLLLLGSSLAIGTVVYLLDKRRGGQVIDLRPGAPRVFFRSPDVIYGLVVIQASDGAVHVEVKEPRGMFGEVIDALKGVLTDLGKMGVSEIGKCVEAAVGESATVTMSRAVP